MITRVVVQQRLWHLWLWIVDLWEFLVLLTLGFHPARSLLSLHRDTTETCETLTTCLELYRRSTVGSSLSQLKDLLTTCDSLSISQLTTDDGYNMLQLAVEKGDIEFVEYLLRERKVNPNISKCSLPLHIALSKGSMNMVQLLLDWKARPQQRAGMCYPQPHVPTYDSHSKFFFVSPSMVCGGMSKDAFQRAIDRDSVELLELCLRSKSCSRLNVLLLHHACDVGAMRCIKHLIEVWGADVNATDNRGCSAIMHSLRGDLEVIEYLILQGAEVNVVSYQAQNILHKLYCGAGHYVSDILEKTKLFLALGADSHLSELDVFRNTALNYLCMRCAVLSDTDEEYQLRQCLGLLLCHNADTSIADSEDRLPLLRLLQCSCLRAVEDQCDGARSTSGRADNYQDNHSENHHHAERDGWPERIHHILKLFCQARSSSIQGTINKDNETAIFYILRMACNYEEVLYMRSLQLLLDNGANINHVAVTQSPGNNKPSKYLDVHAKSLISVIRDRARLELQMITSRGSVSTEEACQCNKDGVPSFATSMLEALFKAGLDPNATQIDCRTQSQAENVNALASFMTLIQGTQSVDQLHLIQQWIRVILQWGGDPELQSYRAEPQICTSQGSIFLKQTTALPVMTCFMDSTSHHWIENSETMLQIIKLLANCMSQKKLLRTFIQSTPSVLSPLHQLAGSNRISDIYHYVESLTSQPWTLQMVARHRIYCTLRGKVHRDNVDALPLPTALKAKISLLT